MVFIVILGSFVVCLNFVLGVFVYFFWSRVLEGFMWGFGSKFKLCFVWEVFLDELGDFLFLLVCFVFIMKLLWFEQWFVVF